jgi:hypothetical protein
VRAAAVDAACSHSGAAVPAGPMDASEGGIRAAKNYVVGGGGGGELNPRPRLWYHGRGPSFTSSTIKPR